MGSILLEMRERPAAPHPSWLVDSTLVGQKTWSEHPEAICPDSARASTHFASDAQSPTIRLIATKQASAVPPHPPL